MAASIKKLSWQTWLVVVLVVGALQRVALYLAYPPVIYSDTDAYRRLSVTVLEGWSHYDGTRPPGYPVFMALVGPDSALYLVQLVLGLLTTALFFWLGWRLSGSPIFGAAAGLAHTLNVAQLFFEANLLTEAPTAFLLALMLGGFILSLSAPPRWRWGLWLAVGIFAALTAVTRSLFLFLPVWAALLLAVLQRNWRARFGALLAVMLPTVILVGLWVNLLNTLYAIPGITTVTGYHLMNHTSDYFELVPDGDAALRDTYIKYRDAAIAQRGNSVNAIWDAIPEMMEVSGLDFHTLSARLARISMQLILEHPERYLATTAEGWWMFWRAPVYWKPAALGPLRGALEAIGLGERALLFGANMLFLLSTLLALFWRRWRNWLRLTPTWVFIASTVWLTSIMQTLPEHGDNPRWLIPLQSWVVLWVLWLGFRWIRRKPAPANTDPQGKA